MSSQGFLNTPPPPPSPPPSQGGSGGNLIPAILSGAVIILLAATIYLFVRVDSLKKDVASLRDSTKAEIANLREASSATTATARKHIDEMKDELEATRRRAEMQVGQAKAETLKRAEQLAAALAEEQRRQEAKLTGEIGEVKQATTEASTRIGEVKGDVTAVKTDVEATKAELQKTIAELKRANGDMGVMSGLIATNSKELQALREMGERNYFEFNLTKTKAPQKIGDIAIHLKGADPKKNKYTIDVIADDKRVEKKDKNLNEPVQFFVSKAKAQPYEIVVNEIKKDNIIGYLATPKVQQGR